MTDVYRTPRSDMVLHPSGWARVGRVEIVRLPMLDARTGLFARASCADLEEVAAREGGRLCTMLTLRAAWEVGLRLTPVTLVHKPADTLHMQGRDFCERHDRAVLAQLAAAKWDGIKPVANVGKTFVRPVPPDYVRKPGMCRNGGWFKANGQPIQPGGPGSEHHDRANYTDYSQLAVIERGAIDSEPPPMTTTTRPTIRRGDRGAHVAAWQAKIGVGADGAFGPLTETATKAWQARQGLYPDGIVGAKSWATVGEEWAASSSPARLDPRAPACLAALRDANATWPSRKRASDGIMGDAAHMARAKPGVPLKGHNAGDAVDITHDPASGCDGSHIAVAAMRDPRVEYIIWNRRIWSVARAGEGWRKYSGANPHTHHVHIEISAAKRGDSSPWPWAE